MEFIPLQKKEKSRKILNNFKMRKHKNKNFFEQTSRLNKNPGGHSF